MPPTTPTARTAFIYTGRRAENSLGSTLGSIRYLGAEPYDGDVQKLGIRIKLPYLHQAANGQEFVAIDSSSGDILATWKADAPAPKLRRIR